jgi:hypothetical protein
MAPHFIPWPPAVLGFRHIMHGGIVPGASGLRRVAAGKFRVNHLHGVTVVLASLTGVVQ